MPRMKAFTTDTKIRTTVFRSGMILLAVFAGMNLVISCNNKENGADAYGNFEADELLIAAEAQGRILSFSAKEGDFLNPDAALVEIDSLSLILKRDQLLAGIKANAARVKGIRAQIEVLQIQLSNLEREFDRVSRLLDDGAASRKQYDDLEGQVKQLRAQLKAQEAQQEPLYAEKQSLEAQVAQINEQISKTRVYVPKALNLLVKYKEEGELCIPGQALCKVADLDRLFLRAYISGKQLADIKIGQEVQVMVDSGDSLKTFPGKVNWISAQAEFTPKIIQTKEERVNLVYALRVEVKNDGSLKIGMPGEMKLSR